MSARKPKLILSPNARKDVSDALLYTQRQWGKPQRATYKALIDRTLREIIEFPESGRLRDDLGEGLRVRPAGSHVIYYRIADGEVIVSRILHGRQEYRDEPSRPSS